MTSPLPQECRVEAASDVHSHDADDDWPSELIRAREDDSQDVRQQLEEVLESDFDGGERAAVIELDFLVVESIWGWMEAHGLHEPCL